jgi:hypothetical protein
MSHGRPPLQDELARAGKRRALQALKALSASHPSPIASVLAVAGELGVAGWACGWNWTELDDDPGEVEVESRMRLGCGFGAGPPTRGCQSRYLGRMSTVVATTLRKKA